MIKWVVYSFLTVYRPFQIPLPQKLAIVIDNPFMTLWNASNGCPWRRKLNCGLERKSFRGTGVWPFESSRVQEISAPMIYESLCLSEGKLSLMYIAHFVFTKKHHVLWFSHHHRRALQNVWAKFSLTSTKYQENTMFDFNASKNAFKSALQKGIFGEMLDTACWIVFSTRRKGLKLM